jgi:parallel beta helix pectate lyase-like protein
MLAPVVALAVIVSGGTGAGLALVSAHKSLPSGAPPSAALPSGELPSGVGPTEIGASGAGQGLGDCSTVPHACGFPDGTNTGVPRGTVLRSVPGQVSSGPGWHYSATGNDVIVNANGAVLSDLSIPYDVVIDASDVTVRDVRVVTGGAFGISLRHTTGVTIEDSTISGRNLTSGRVDSAVTDVYSDSTGIVIKSNNISQFRIGVQISTGLIADNYIHDPGYIPGDHTDGILAAGSAKPLTIDGNTIFNNLGQTDDITLDASSSGHAVANKIVVDNLLAGGDYSIYGGTAHNDPTSNIIIEDNGFGQLYYPRGGHFGPVAYFDPTGSGNVWSGNVWLGTGLRGPAAERPGTMVAG